LVRVPVAGLRWGEVVLALERNELADAHIELVRDPRIGAPLADPCADLIELGLEGPAGHGGGRLPTRLHMAVEWSPERIPVLAMPRSLYDRPGRNVGLLRGAMLVLTRKSNQSIMIGDDIEVSVLAIMGEKVRIGIEAPRSVPVFRKEVYLEIQQDSSRPEAEREAVDQALDKLKGS
jgi:carbon storage regulator